MRLITGDLFDHNKSGPDAICITTNGAVDRKSKNVMGAGCARAARGRWPGIEYNVGEAITKEGNVPQIITEASPPNADGRTLNLRSGPVDVPYHIVTFPVKPAQCTLDQLLPRYRKQSGYGEGRYPGWMAGASLKLIEQSAVILSGMAFNQEWKSIVLPCPGCGLGGLDFESEVKPLLEKLLDERFFIITFP